MDLTMFSDELSADALARSADMEIKIYPVLQFKDLPDIFIRCETGTFKITPVAPPPG
jgi:hypothetical protein